MATVRPARETDLEAAMPLLTRLLGEEAKIDGVPVARSPRAHEAFRRVVGGDRGAAFVAEDGDGILGLITVSYNLATRFGGDYAEIEELIVNERARGKGVGAALVTAAIDAARNRGCADIGLYALEHNVPFYEKLGFAYRGPSLRQDL